MSNRTFDPYDFRFSFFGSFLYNLYFKFSWLIFLIAIFEIFKPILRFFKLLKKYEYPIVEAFQIRIDLLNKNLLQDDVNSIFKLGQQSENWIGFGLNRKLPIDKNVVYESDAVFTTISVYVYRALVSSLESPNLRIDRLDEIELFFVEGVRFFQIDNQLLCSYSQYSDRFVVNSMAYVLSVYDDMRFRKSKIYIQNSTLIDTRIDGLLKSLLSLQNENGSWPYAIHGNSFVDCLHSAFIMESLLVLKTVNKIVFLEKVNLALDYLNDFHFDKNLGLYLRYPKNYKGLRWFLNYFQVSLYDNVEMYNILNVLGDKALAEGLKKNISRIFKDDFTLFNSFLFSFRYGKNYLRWGLIQKRFYFLKHE